MLPCTAYLLDLYCIAGLIQRAGSVDIYNSDIDIENKNIELT